MTEIITSFLDEVRQLPKFIEAARSDEKYLHHFHQIETGLYAFAESDEPYVIDVFDRILETVKRRDWSLNQRLLEVSRLAGIVRDNGRSVQ
jgi:hypothetical protein